MRKILFLLFVIVIILVSLNWFTETRARDLSSLTDQERILLQQHLKRTATPTSSESTLPDYESPLQIDDTVFGKLPAGKATTSPPKPQRHDDLRPFGAELFDSPDGAVPPDEIAASPDYVIGAGDHLVLSLWGRVEQEYDVTVDRQGEIFIPKVGTIAAAGLTLARFEQTARTRLASVYSEFDMRATISKIRSIRVYVTGEVRRPGAYTVSSLSSLLNLLYLAGGPTETGSMRQVRLMRNGSVAATIDLYRFLLEGDNRNDVRLESGDALFVPVAGHRVGILGEIRRPAMYELIGTETVADLLRLAGNPTPQAHLQRIMLERISPQKQWEVIDINLDPTAGLAQSNRVLADGDRVTVQSIYEAETNMVVIGGRVKHPGHYERGDSIRVRDLVLLASLPNDDVYYDRAVLFRRRPGFGPEVVSVNLRTALAGDTIANIPLWPRDSLHIYSVQEVDRERYVNVGGEIRRPGKYPLYDSMTVADLVFLAGSFTRGASRLTGELARTDSLGTVTLVPISFLDSASLHMPLREDDRLYIRQIPEWELHRAVRVTGEVRFPGEYVLATREETLYQLLGRTGGFTSAAFTTGAIFERPTIGQNLRRIGLFDRARHDIQLVADSNGVIVDTVHNWGVDTTVLNRIVIDLPRLLASGGKQGDIVLEPGDRIHIPSIPSGISVLGEIGSPGTIQFQQRKNAEFYVDRAGGFTPQADKSQTKLFKANGQVFAGSSTLGKRVELGDVIIVPARIDKNKDWLKTVGTALTATASAVTTVLLIGKL